MIEPKKIRTYLYSEEAPQGRLFTDEAEYNKAIEAGWADAPQDIGLDPKELKKKREGQNPGTKVEKLTKKISALEAESASVKNNYESVVKENESLRKDVAELTKDLEDNQKFITKLTTENDELKKNVDTLTQGQADYDKLKKENEDLQKQLKDAKKK